MNNETLLLNLRAETLRANLTRLKGHLQSAPDRRTELSDLALAVNRALASVADAKQTKITLERSVPVELLDQLENLEGQLKAAQKELRGVNAGIDLMKGKVFRANENEVGKVFVQTLEKKAAPLPGNLDVIPDSATAAEKQKRWDGLKDVLAADTEQIFSDYVEFLGGVALRDTGFDENISQVTDELLRAYNPGGNQDLLTLPLRRKALAATFAGIVRLTFPDWTVWSLPSAALEFWNVVARKTLQPALEESLKYLPAGKPKIQPGDLEYLGDAYATYTMGPAYAYHAVTLLLDPEEDANQTRVRIILAMLQGMDSQEPGDPPYLNVRRQLLESWNAARQQLNHAPLSFNVDKPQDDDTTDPEGAGVRLLTSTFMFRLANQTASAFVVDVWRDIQSWAEPLLNGQPEKINIPEGADMRHVLNAGWLARVDPARKPDLDLTLAVKQLQQAVSAKIAERKKK